MTDTHQDTGVEEGPKTPCPNCNRPIPCGAVPKMDGKNDILDRIRDFQARMWERKQKDSLESIADAVVREIINLRIKVSGLHDHGVGDQENVPPVFCPHCNKRLPYNASLQKNQRDIVDRIKDLQVRLKEKRSKDPAYAILDDALVEIDRLRSRIEALGGKN